MTTSLNTLVAAEHIADLRRTADRGRSVAGAWLPTDSAVTPSPVVVLRLAGCADTHRLQRLAGLDDAPALDGPVLLALIDDEAVAALSLLDGRTIANPFVATNEAVALLRLRAEHLSGRRARRRRRTILWPRLV